MLLGGACAREIGLTEYFGYRLPGPGEPGESTPLEVARYCARMIEEHGADGFEGKVATVGSTRRSSSSARCGGDRPVARAAAGRERRLDGADRPRGPAPPGARSASATTRTRSRPRTSSRSCARATTASFSTHVVDLERAVRLRVPDTIVTNLNELGGIRRTVELIAACARFDVGFRFHSGETGVGSAAYLHVSAAVEHVREPSQTLFRWYADDVIAGGPFVPTGGVVAVPTGPGLGVELDRAALRRLHERYRSEGPFPPARRTRATAGRSGAGDGRRSPPSAHTWTRPRSGSRSRSGRRGPGDGRQGLRRAVEVPIEQLDELEQTPR